MTRLTAFLMLTLAPLACLAMKPHEGEYLLVDFRSYSPAEVQDAFQNVTRHHMFKVYGDNRYLIVLENDQSKDMKSLLLPRDATNIRTLPMEHMDVFVSHFEPEDLIKDVGPFKLPEDNLTFIERTWSPEYNEKELKAIIKEQALSTLKNDKVNMDIYIATAALPIKHIMFASRSDYEVTDLLLKDVDIFGGYKKLQIDVQKIYKIFPSKP